MTPRKRSRLPQLCRHRASGQAVVRLSGKDHYCGPYGSQQAQDEYERLLSLWLANGRAAPPESGSRASTLVVELCVAYMEHCTTHYRRPDGTATSEVRNNCLALRALRGAFGRTPAADFGPLSLRAVRTLMVEQGLSRGVVNGHVGRIKRMFRWAVERELVPPSVYHGVMAVRGLERGRTDARETAPIGPVPEADVEAVLPELRPAVAAMVRLMHLTGMRVGEVVLLRMRDVDRSGAVWEYAPPQHKTAYRGRDKLIPLGPRAQEVVRPFLQADPDAYLFSPRVSEEERNAERRAARETPMTPSQRGRRPRRAPLREPGEHYHPDAVRKAVRTACKLAGVPHWHPHQLRHSAATRLRREFGVEVARVVLGHASALVTEVYAEVDREKAREAMARVG